MNDPAQSSLIAEIKRLHEATDRLGSENRRMQQEIKRLREENEKLRAEIAAWRAAGCTFNCKHACKHV